MKNYPDFFHLFSAGLWSLVSGYQTLNDGFLSSEMDKSPIFRTPLSGHFEFKCPCPVHENPILYPPVPTNIHSPAGGGGSAW